MIRKVIILAAILILIISGTMFGSDINNNYVIITEVDDIGSRPNIYTNLLPIGEKDSYVEFSFNLKESACVKLGIYTDNITKMHPKLGNIDVIEITSENGIHYIYKTIVEDNADYQKYYYLDAGTYTIRLVRDEFDYHYTAGSIKLGVDIHYLSASSNSTRESVVSLVNNQESVGLYTLGKNELWYIIDCKNASDLILQSNLSTINIYRYQYYIHIYNQENNEILLKDGKYNLSKGIYYIKVDADYNKGQISLKPILINRDIASPKKANIIAYRSGSDVLKGTGESGSSVTVKYNKRTYYGVIDKVGKFKIKIDSLIVGKKIEVILKDDAGNESTKSIVIVKNRELAQPKFTAYNSRQKTLIGTTAKNAIVTITFNSNHYTGKSDNNGKFDIKKLPKLKAGDVIKVKVKDNAGNTSKTKDFTLG